LAALAVAAGTIPAASAAIGAPAVRVEAWKDAGCGCCGGWVRHLREDGFEVVARDVADLQTAKRAHGVPEALWSCHTARVGGYVVEGHVPAADIRRLLAERPRAGGLAAPGMPASAPGMDVPGQPYDVVLFGVAEGGDRVFARH
jgi:hypothetical protein